MSLSCKTEFKIDVNPAWLAEHCFEQPGPDCQLHFSITESLLIYVIISTLFMVIVTQVTYY